MTADIFHGRLHIQKKDQDLYATVQAECDMTWRMKRNQGCLNRHNASDKGRKWNLNLSEKSSYDIWPVSKPRSSQIAYHFFFYLLLYLSVQYTNVNGRRQNGSSCCWTSEQKTCKCTSWNSTLRFQRLFAALPISCPQIGTLMWHREFPLFL